MFSVIKKFDSLAFSIKVFFILFILSIESNAKPFDLEFYNVGQGHCAVMRSAKNGVLIVDAGSSSTIGVDEVTAEEGKNRQLANYIFSSIQTELSNFPLLNFIITHADKDHLNLATLITQQVMEKCDQKVMIKFILGGIEGDYSTDVAATLVDFIKENSILYTYGASFIQDKVSSLWIPPENFRFNSGDGESVSFFSVKRDTKPLGEKPLKDEEKKNASSIVLKIEGQGSSVMITGDKTRSEIAILLGLHEDQGTSHILRADILLATHHGSEEDFSPDWMNAVSPSYLVVSAGISSFGHPRPVAVCSESILNNPRITRGVPWHPVRAYGILSSMPILHDFFMPVCAGDTGNFRATPYTYSLTNAGIYVTADQGTVRFSFESGKEIAVIPSKQKGHNDFQKALIGFLSSQKDQLSELRVYPSTKLTHDFFRDCVYRYSTSLKGLDLRHHDVRDDEDAKFFVDIVRRLRGLSFFAVNAKGISDINKEQIIQAWEHRGLEFLG